MISKCKRDIRFVEYRKHTYPDYEGTEYIYSFKEGYPPNGIIHEIVMKCYGNHEGKFYYILDGMSECEMKYFVPFIPKDVLCDHILDGDKLALYIRDKFSDIILEEAI